MVDLEVRGAINVVEACAQTDSIQKIVYNSSLTAAIWRENICSEKDVDEKSWSNQDFCRKKKVHVDPVKTIFSFLIKLVVSYCFVSPNRIYSNFPASSHIISPGMFQ